VNVKSQPIQTIVTRSGLESPGFGHVCG